MPGEQREVGDLVELGGSNHNVIAKADDRGNDMPYIVQIMSPAKSGWCTARHSDGKECKVRSGEKNMKYIDPDEQPVADNLCDKFDRLVTLSTNPDEAVAASSALNNIHDRLDMMERRAVAGEIKVLQLELQVKELKMELRKCKKKKPKAEAADEGAVSMDGADDG